MRITAAVLPELHADFVVQEVELEEPRAGEALVRVVACGVCHTDDITRHGDLPFPAPGVLGHEGAGVVETIGDGVTNVAPGNRVVIGWPFCGDCRNCLDGEPRYCGQLGPLVAGGGRLDGSTALASTDGSPLHSHFFGQSSFATHALVGANALVPVPDDVPLELVGPLACGIGTGAGAIVNALRPSLGSSVVVYGVGSVGLAAVMAARCTGATTIVAVDLQPGRLELARELGATHALDGRVQPVEAVKEICGGLADFSLECTGNVDVLRLAADSVGMRGTCALIGGAPANAQFTLDHTTTLWGKRVVGILGGESRSTRLIPGLLDLWRQGRFPFDRLVTTFPLERINDAFAAAREGAVVKPVLAMS
jgi:Zn-dependent alcohol dehydrogenase